MKRIAISALVLVVHAGVAPAQEPPLETIPVDREAATVPADAAPVPYDWVAARVRQVEPDEGASVEALGFEGSVLLLPNVYAVGAILLGEGDEPDSAETTQVELGAGYRASLTPKLDAAAAFRFVKLEAETADEQLADEIGYQFDAGVRTMLLDELEVGAGVTYTAIFEAGHTFLAGSALYRVWPGLSVGAEALYGNSSQSYGVLLRWAF